MINEVIEGEKESVTISFLNKKSKEELKSYYESLLRNAYQISEEDNSREYTSMGMKNDYIYSISVSSSSREYNNQNYKIDHHIISIPLYTTKCQRFAFPVKQPERFEELQQHIKNSCKLGKASLFYKRSKWYFAVTIKIAAKKLLTLM